MPSRNAFDDQPPVIVQARLQCGIKENLFQDVLLSVASTESIHLAKHRTHEINGPFAVSATQCQYSLSHRERHLTDDPFVDARPLSVIPHGIKHSPCRLMPASSAESHHPMRQGKGGLAI